MDAFGLDFASGRAFYYLYETITVVPTKSVDVTEWYYRSPVAGEIFAFNYPLNVTLHDTNIGYAMALGNYTAANHVIKIKAYRRFSGAPPGNYGLRVYDSEGNISLALADEYPVATQVTVSAFTDLSVSSKGLNLDLAEHKNRYIALSFPVGLYTYNKDAILRVFTINYSTTFAYLRAKAIVINASYFFLKPEVPPVLRYFFVD